MKTEKYYDPAWRFFFCMFKLKSSMILHLVFFMFKLKSSMIEQQIKGTIIRSKQREFCWGILSTV